MRFYLSLPTDHVSAPDVLTADSVASFAETTERVGFAGVCVTEHPFPADEWLRSPDGHHALDPFVALSFAAAATATLELLTYLCVIPYRNPFVTAKASLSLHVLSGGRFVLGAGAGYLQDEFRALGVDFAARNELCDEGLVAIRRAWAEDGVKMTGRNFDVTGNTMLPRPSPAPRVLAGGNSKRAIRRAVDLGDGWIPMRYARTDNNTRRSSYLDSVDDLRASLAYADAYRASNGSPAWTDVITMPFVAAVPGARGYDSARLRDHVDELEEAGVSGVVVRAPGRDRASVVDRIEALGAELIARR